ncbi:MAG: hypothetical protein C4547_11735, partial [Phycisphaerales bacterium]
MCPTNPGEGPDICVAWSETPDPEEDTDFRVDYLCEGCETAPEIELITGSATWRVWSVANGGGEGDIGILAAYGADDYSVRIIKVDGTTESPGAANVGLLDLNPSNAANYSSLGSGEITGDLTGNLFLQRSSGDAGGTADGFVIGGDVYGDITLYGPTGDGFTIEGSVQPGVTISLELGDGFTIEGDLSVNNVVPLTYVFIGEIDGGAFLVEGNVGRYVNISVG